MYIIQVCLTISDSFPNSNGLSSRFHLKMATWGYTTDPILRHIHVCIKHIHIYIYANNDILIMIMTIIVVPCNKRCDMIMTMVVMLTIAVYVCIMLCVHSRKDVWYGVHRYIYIYVNTWYNWTQCNESINDNNKNAYLFKVGHCIPLWMSWVRLRLLEWDACSYSYDSPSLRFVWLHQLQLGIWLTKNTLNG